MKSVHDEGFGSRNKATLNCTIVTEEDHELSHQTEFLLEYHTFLTIVNLAECCWLVFEHDLHYKKETLCVEYPMGVTLFVPSLNRNRIL